LVETRERCPVCGLPIDFYEKKTFRSRKGSRTYIYAVHILRDPLTGKRIRKRCYLGPEDSYVYVSKTHFRDGLQFYGLLKEDRVLDYLRNLLQRIRSMDLSDSEKISIARLLEETAKDLRASANLRNNQ